MAELAPPVAASDSLIDARGPPHDYRDVRLHVSEGVATVTIHRPKALNAYTTATLSELHDALTRATRDDRVGVIVLTGTGTRAFCTGGDVKEYASRYTDRPREYWQYMGLFKNVIEAILDCGKPTICRLNGMAMGGGNELHLACDLSIAPHHAVLGQVGVGVGSVACGGATQWLPLVVGDRRARSMLLLNERVAARTALDWGLVNRCVPSVQRGGNLLDTPSPEEMEQAERGINGYSIDLAPLDAAVAETSRRLLEMFPECLRYTKEQVNYWKKLSWHQTIGHARDWLTLHFATPEPHEGMKGFVTKRRPRIKELRSAAADGGSPEYFHGPPNASCKACGAGSLPAAFIHCGQCGALLG